MAISSMSTEPRRAAVYARVSTKDKGQDVETQLMPLREYCRYRGLQIVEEFIDAGISGSKEKRPALDRLMLQARKRKVDVVIVVRFDRFARSVSHLLKALEEFNALGVDFISVNESIDTSTPMGKMVFTIIGAVAEMERALIRERVKAGMDRFAKQGGKFGRPQRIVDKEKVLRLYKEHRSLRTVAELTGVGRDKVARIVKAAEVA